MDQNMARYSGVEVMVVGGRSSWLAHGGTTASTFRAVLAANKTSRNDQSNDQN
jgi:hypothetical protein